MMQDQPTYPGLGHIYPGDYYEAIPWDEYIDPDQTIPQGPVFDIRNYGARPEAKLLNTEAIAACCRACGEAGGGVILVSGGDYVTGTVRLPSHCTLFIAYGSSLVASRDVRQLLTHDPAYRDDRKGESTQGALLMIDGAEQVTVTGGGRICGQGEWYVYEPRRKPLLTPFDTVMLPRRDQAGEINTVPGSIRTLYRDRIRYSEDKYGESKPNLVRPSAMVWVRDSSHITFRNIVLQDAMSWTLHTERCEHMLFRNVVINDNRHVANADGIDLCGTSHAEVEHCFISCADDGIVLKNPITSGRAMHDIHVCNCTVLTVMNAFKIGTETRHDISDVLVEDCEFMLPDIYPGSVSGISIESCDGSHVHHITLRGIHMRQVSCPLYILLNRRNRYRLPMSSDPQDAFWGGAIHDITIENVAAEDCDVPCIISGYHSALPGEPEVRKPVTNISISRFSMSYRPTRESVTLPERMDELLFDYP